MKKHIDIPEIPSQILQAIPKVDQCLAALDGEQTIQASPVSLKKAIIRNVLEELRQAILSGRITAIEQICYPHLINKMVERIHHAQQPRFRRVINATGVIVHTNLGRSILPGQSINQLLEAGYRYSNLEFDLTTGKRGSRYSLVEDLLCELTGAEAALVVNNNAAAVLIALESLAKNKDVLVSRGQLVEIGGSFRIPDVMSRSGARLVEVGATNRTHLRDYENNISPETALLLKVHCSNYRIIGFTGEVSNEALVALGKQHAIPVMEDLGSGCFIDLSNYGLMKEPTVQEVVHSGVDVVTFSGDKLLGGPQAGIILGKRCYIELIKRNPLNRALRIDKFTLSTLESVLRLYRDPQAAMQQIPTLAMIAQPAAMVERRAKRLFKRIRGALADRCQLQVHASFAMVGGGAMPEQKLESRALRLQPAAMSVHNLEMALRALDIPVVGRIENQYLWLDMRTVADDEVRLLGDQLLAVFAKEKGSY